MQNKMSPMEKSTIIKVRVTWGERKREGGGPHGEGQSEGRIKVENGIRLGANSGLLLEVEYKSEKGSFVLPRVVWNRDGIIGREKFEVGADDWE